MLAKEIVIRQRIMLADHYGLTVRRVNELPEAWQKTMIRHVATGRRCDHPKREQ